MNSPITENTVNRVLDQTHFGEAALDVAESFYAPESFDRRTANDLIARGINEVYQQYAPMGGRITTTQHNERIIWLDELGDVYPVGSYELTLAEDAPPEGENVEHIEEMIQNLRGYVIREALDVLRRADREALHRELDGASY